MAMLDKKQIIVPFLKWAGGKRWLIDSFPELFNVEYDRYLEPFLGSGAVYFHIQPKKAILADINENLVNTYLALKEDPESVMYELNKHHKRHSADYYYRMREKICLKPHTKAAQFIYLNRTCWNGLYRVNLSGKFNVPKGTKNNVVLASDNFEGVSKLLANAVLSNQGYEETINNSQKGDFIFVDPPYTVKHNFNGFIKYNEKLFSWDDQVKLSELLGAAKNRGVKIISTNAYHDTIIDLYDSNFELWEVSRYSHVSASSRFRKRCEELLIIG